MPPKEGNPTCVDCKKTECLLWTKVELGQICQECFQQRAAKESADNIKSAEKKEDSKIEEIKENDIKETVTKSENKNATNTAVTIEEKRLRKSTRATRFKAKQSINVSSGSNASNGNAEKNSSSGGGGGAGSGSAGGGNTKNQCKGRNRRSVFKRTPFKTPTSHATTHCVESLFYKGSYMQIGDIVSLVDGRDNIFYAQIRGLLVDNYCEKSAFLTWLIPTQESPDPKEGFDAATYLIGPDEELSRKLSCLEFVMHAPSNYYLDRSTPFPLPDEMEFNARPGGYIWTTLPEIQRNKPTVPSSV